MADTLFQPLQLRNLSLKNRIFRSNMSGRFDNCHRGNSDRISRELNSRAVVSARQRDIGGFEFPKISTRPTS